MAEISDLEILPYEIFEEILSYLSEEDVLYLCQTNKNILSYCDLNFWAYRALSKGYIKNTKEFGDEKSWPKNNYGKRTAQERYLQLLSKKDCVKGSEKYVENWKIECPYRAGKKGDKELINYFLKKLSVSYSSRDNALYGAAEGEHIELVKYLIEEKNGNVNSALAGASFGGHLYLVKHLIEDYKALDLNRSLWAAAFGGHINIVKYLIEKQGVYDFDSALIGAAEGGHLDIVKYLIDKGANELHYALLKAEDRGHLEIVKYLKKLIEGLD